MFHGRTHSLMEEVQEKVFQGCFEIGSWGNVSLKQNQIREIIDQIAPHKSYKKSIYNLFV